MEANNTRIKDTHVLADGFKDAITNPPIANVNGVMDAFECTNESDADNDVPIDNCNGVINTYETTTVSNDDKSNLPIDRGWAWVIVGASILQNFIIAGQLKCHGIFFVQLQKQFKTSSSLTSLVFTIQNIVFSVGALLIMNIGQSVSTRLMVLIGAVISTGMLIITGLTGNIVILNLALGVGTGLPLQEVQYLGASYALIQPTILAMLCSYFVRYIGLANSLYSGAVSLGGLVLAPFYTKILEYYGYPGLYIIAAGLHAQLAVVGVLLRPLNFYNTTHKKGYTSRNELSSLVIETNNHVTEETAKMINLSDDERKSSPLLSESESIMVNGSGKSSLVVDSFLNSRTARYTGSGLLTNSSLDMSVPRPVNNQDVKQPSEDIKQTNTFLGCAVRIFVRVLDIELIKMPVFQYYFVCNVFLCAGCMLIGSNVPPHAFDCGIDDDRIALLVSINSVVDLISKVAFGYIADRQSIQRSKVVAVCTFVLGIVCLFFNFMNTFAVLVGFSIFIGCLQGVYFILYAVILLDFLGHEKFRTAVGIICLGQGFASAAAFPIAGALRDYTGHWHAAYTFVGIMLLVGGTMLWFLPVVVKRFNKKTAVESCNGDLTS